MVYAIAPIWPMASTFPLLLKTVEIFERVSVVSFVRNDTSVETTPVKEVNRLAVP